MEFPIKYILISYRKARRTPLYHPLPSLKIAKEYARLGRMTYRKVTIFKVN